MWRTGRKSVGKRSVRFKVAGRRAASVYIPWFLAVMGGIN